MRNRVHSKPWTFVAILMLGLVTAPAAAQEEHNEATHEEHFHKHELGFIVGATYEVEAGDNLFTIGGEYGHRFTPEIAASAAFEHLSHVGAWVFAFPVAFRIHEGFFVSTGPGVEHVSRRGEEHELDGHAEDSQHGVERQDEGADNLFLWRVGAGYVLHMSERFSVSAGVAYDWVFEEHGTAGAWVYGVKLGVGF